MPRFSLQRSNLYGDFSIARGQVKPGIFERRMDFQEYDEEIMKRYFASAFLTVRSQDLNGVRPNSAAPAPII